MVQIKQAKVDPGAGQSLDKRDMSVSSVVAPYILDYISEMGRDWVVCNTHTHTTANLLDSLGKIIKMKLSSSLSRIELDSPCYSMCYQLEGEKKLWKPPPPSSCSL